ncbi:unnamed protein product [marine sediment metagenome]|uniref:Uncharacterized protein n=1 Tax=marine sediment metagenome TaxID=412755 RepID=X1SFP5_9ZZZZ
MLHVDLSVFKEKNKVIAVVDADPGSGSVRRKFQKRCKEYKIPCRRLKRYSTENYFSVNALRKVFGKQMRKEIKELKPNVKVEEQIGFSPKASGRKIIENMDIKELEGTDLLEFCKNVERYASE